MPLLEVSSYIKSAPMRDKCNCTANCAGLCSGDGDGWVADGEFGGLSNNQSPLPLGRNPEQIAVKVRLARTIVRQRCDCGHKEWRERRPQSTVPRF